ncbi:MAG: universal stress protein [Desulfomonilia bacterium]|jgi:nucleotide-binding universal stress UspA family protein
MFTPKKILVPTDFSESADKAVEHAADIAARYHAKVVVLHVVEENVRQCAIDYLVDYCISEDFVTQFEREIMKTSNERLQKQIVNIKGSTVDIEYEIKKGEPADVILDEQVKLGADLIVIASHGKAGAAKHAIGGVTDKVVRTAACNVMVSKI